MKKIKFLIRNYFGFSQRETNGFLVLSFLLILFLLILFLFDKFYNPSLISSDEDQKILDSLSSVIILNNESPINVDSKKYSGIPINPNSANEEELKLLFGEKIGKIIVKFRNKGGSFKVKGDIKKIYGINKEMFEDLSPFIALPDTLIPNFKKKQQVLVLLDINKSDTTQLIKLKGIGSVLAARILKYRKVLGGFVSKDQYKEVYGLSLLAISELENKTFISEGFIPVKLKINAGSENELAKHPYIGKFFAKKILKYRNAFGNFKSTQDVLLLDTTNHQISKVLPYLVF